MRRLLLLITLTGLLLATLTALGQAPTGRVGGTVQDSSDALIPGVSIELINIETQSVIKTQTDETGQYSFEKISPGVYNVTAQLSGFEPAVFKSVTVNANETRRFTFKLQVSQRGRYQLL